LIHSILIYRLKLVEFFLKDPMLYQQLLLFSAQFQKP